MVGPVEPGWIVSRCEADGRVADALDNYVLPRILEALEDAFGDQTWAVHEGEGAKPDGFGPLEPVTRIRSIEGFDITISMIANTKEVVTTQSSVSVIEVQTRATPVHPRVCVARVPHPSGYAYAQRLLFALRGEGIPARLEFHEAVERSAEDWYYEDRDAEEARLAKLPMIDGCRAVTEDGECEGCGETTVLYERVACTLGYAGHPGAEFTAFQVCTRCCLGVAPRPVPEVWL